MNTELKSQPREIISFFFRISGNGKKFLGEFFIHCLQKFFFAFEKEFLPIISSLSTFKVKLIEA